jgi:uncharacterized alpha-E superfamily protein
MLAVHRGLQEARSTEEAAELMPFVSSFLPEKLIEQEAQSAHAPDQRVEALLSQAIWSTDYAGSIVNNLASIKRTTDTVRERICGNTMQLMRDMPRNEHFLGQGIGSPLDERMSVQLVDLLDTLAGFAGMVFENTTRGQDWYFLDMGRRMERADNILGALGHCLGRSHPQEPLLLGKLLDYLDSTVTYRRRYLTVVAPLPVCDLLIQDGCNPRSLAFQVETLRQHLMHLPHHREESTQHPLDRCALSLYSRVWLADLNELMDLADQNERPTLNAFLEANAEDLAQLTEWLSRRYFAVTTA